jgi:hypothetical protein
MSIISIQSQRLLLGYHSHCVPPLLRSWVACPPAALRVLSAWIDSSVLSNHFYSIQSQRLIKRCRQPAVGVLSVPLQLGPTCGPVASTQPRPRQFAVRTAPAGTTHRMTIAAPRTGPTHGPRDLAPEVPYRAARPATLPPLNLVPYRTKYLAY